MPESKFAKILVEEIINNRFDVKKIHRLWQSLGLDQLNLDDEDEIWKWYVDSTLRWGGVKDELVNDNWPKISILFNRKTLLDSITQISNLNCYSNFTRNCPIKYKQGKFFNKKDCYRNDNFEDCLMPNITKELSWHRQHYRTSKIFLESAKRLFILNIAGRTNGNLNDVVFAIFEKHKHSGASWKTDATEEFFQIFKEMKHYPLKPKSLLMFISNMSMPFMQVNHWPDFDLLTLIPVDTHVKRLSHRFEFVETENPSTNQIKQAFNNVYPQNPRSLNFAMFLLGAEDEMNICTKSPKCDICRKKISKVYDACPYPDKL
jgi:hypothetical protein